MLKVSIFTEAGSGYGFGHLSRCTALKQGLEEFGACVSLYVGGDVEPTRDVVKAEWLNEYLSLFVGVDIIVIDSYCADKTVYGEAAKAAKLGVWFDDTKRIVYPRGYVIDGKNSVLLRKAFFAPSMAHDKNSKKIFISFGGTDRRELVAKITYALRSKFPDFSFVFACAVADEIVGGDDKVMANADEYTVAKAMLECAYAVSAGGQTLLELSALGVPSVAVVIAENQIDSVKRCIDGGNILGAVYATDENWADRAADMLCGDKQISALQIQTKAVANDILRKVKSSGQ